MLILEATQIIDIGDPYEIKFRIRKDFDNLYKKYIEFSQIFVALQIPKIALPKRIPYISTETTRNKIPTKSELYMPSTADPYHIIRTNYWLKILIIVALKPGIHLPPKEQINWNLALKVAKSLANERLSDLQAFQQMHELYKILPILFPEE